MAEAGTVDIENQFDIEIARDIDAIEGDWERLEKNGLLTPFQTRSWLGPFYRELAPRLNTKPLFVVVREKRTGAPAMLLPLCARKYWGVTVIQFADLGVSDYNAPILAKNFDPSPSQWRRLWLRILASFRFGSILRLKNMPRLIGGRANPMALDDNFSKRMEIASWGFKLPASATEYRTRVLQSSFAKELAKKSRRVAKRGKAEFVIAQTPDGRRAAFDLLARQRQARCDEMGRKNILAQDAYRRFYEAAAVDSSEGLVSLAQLKVGGEPVGAMLALNHDNAFHVLMSTFEGGEWKSCSLGNVLILASIEHCIANGVGFFDLTLGNEGYKENFGATPSPLYSAVQPLTLLGVPVASALAFAVFVKTAFERRIERIKLKKPSRLHAG